MARQLLRPARALLLLAFVLLLVGCGSSSRRSCSVVLRAVPAKGQQITATGMRTAQQIVENRVGGLGVSSPQVSVHGDEIVIQYGGSHAPADLPKTLSMTGQLEIFDFEPSLAPPSVSANQQPTPLPSLYKLLEAVQNRADRSSPQAYYLFGTKAPHSVVQGPASTLEQLLTPYKGGKQPAHTVVLKVPANTEPVRCGRPAVCPGAESSVTSTTGSYWYLFKDFPASAQHPNGPPQLTGKDLVESGISADVDANPGEPIVTIKLTRHGSQAFQRITKAEYNRGRVNAGEAGQLGATNQTTIAAYAGHNAVVLDGELEETPYIDYTDQALSQGIFGAAQITEPTTERCEVRGARASERLTAVHVRAGQALGLCPLAGVAGRLGAAEELAHEPVGRSRHAEHEPARLREVEERHPAGAGRDAAAPLQVQVRAVVVAEQVAAGREDRPAESWCARRRSPPDPPGR